MKSLFKIEIYDFEDLTRAALILGVTLFAIFILFVLPGLIESAIIEDKERAQLEEMQVYHSDKGLAEITEDGYINIKIQ